MTAAKSGTLKPVMATILEQKEQLARAVAIPSEIGKGVSEQLITWRMELIEAYANSLSQDFDGVTQNLGKWSDQVSEQLVELRLPLNLALVEISEYRQVIGAMLKNGAKEQNLSFDEFYEILTPFNQAVDQALQFVSRSYMDDFENTIQTANYAVDELSVPIVRVTETVGVIPIVGEIDTKRAQLLMENALKQGEEFELETIILDLSGVSIIDTMVAHQLFKVINSLKLTGVNGIMSGIRPDIVQTMVSLGIDMKGIHTFSSLHRAIQSLQLFDGKVNV
ncbi:STAS domain-containing protein [Halobacillus aidingensis]|uniref:RsbT co-antagonist protein RsbR n=1 Tax=Halobacillus aidingensis TaxID=240303 RepID=A0A1H0G763_HALAD|nr:STAS domain-containing protein [Halobacillus aidingensis]SDO02745.1 rsbT co-antagonist protein RsbR [Halobacillus aidingensis]